MLHQLLWKRFHAGSPGLHPFQFSRIQHGLAVHDAEDGFGLCSVVLESGSVPQQNQIDILARAANLVRLFRRELFRAHNFDAAAGRLRLDDGKTMEYHCIG
ncbi:MAG: hypothetical protein DMG08_04785 [Acidobacteria bacterium]|nr:MAG: hypothetical protein DMG08_04785 [Acidobacteriota bacterium]